MNAAGGFVLRNRVLGILAVSRSFGNQGMKELVTAVPYVSETRYIILRTAGGHPPPPFYVTLVGSSS